MTVTTEKYIKKPLYVDGVRITTANFDEVAAWCQGEVQADEVTGQGTGKKFIKVRVHNPKNPRQTKAYVGDWLLYTERGYKVYTNKAFHASFDPVGVTDIPAAPAVMTEETVEATIHPAEEIQTVPATPTAVDPVVEENQDQDARLQTETEPNGKIKHEPVTRSEDKIRPAAAEGKRVLSVEEQRRMDQDEIRELIRSGEVVLAQDLAQP